MSTEKEIGLYVSCIIFIFMLFLKKKKKRTTLCQNLGMKVISDDKTESECLSEYIDSQINTKF